MNKISSRQIMILQLFERSRPVWAVGQMTRALGLPESTIYRHVRNLVTAQFLDPVAGAGYALGPAFIHYESILRETDPLIRHAAPVMAALLAQASPSCSVMLSRKFKDCVMCVHELRGSRAGETGYGRGIAMPMFLGATSKAILAQLPPHRLKAVYLENEERIRRELAIRDWSEFKAHVKEIRRAGFVVTKSEVTKGRIGIAAPIVLNRHPPASITLAGSGWSKKKIEGYVPHVRNAAAQISKALAREPAGVLR
jgi:DNA-binding IclR family transcriptional regulator